MTVGAESKKAKVLREKMDAKWTSEMQISWKNFTQILSKNDFSHRVSEKSREGTHTMNSPVRHSRD